MSEELQAQIQQIWQTIDRYLQQHPVRKNLQSDVTKELKKIKNIIGSKQTVSEEFKKNVQREKNKTNFIEDKASGDDHSITKRNQRRILTVLKSIDKKVASLYEKKDNKKRQASIQFFKYHQSKLATLADWLLSPSRNFEGQSMKKLFNYIKDLMVSHEDRVFQEQLETLYEKIIMMADQLNEISHDLFISSFKNMPKVNDYLQSKQTKETLPRNSIIPQYKMIDLSVIPKMQKQTLFLMFYHHKCQTEQYIAAKELMLRSWRFYKKFYIWLRRSCNPTFDCHDYETGKYIIVDKQLKVTEKSGLKVYRNSLIRELK